MFKLDNEFLQSLGLGGLPVEEKNRLLQMIYERLEMNVGMRLAEKMTDQQLDEFEGFIDRNDEAGALKWLETNFPNYKDVVAEELEKLKGEVQMAAPQILAAQSGGGQQMPPIAQAPIMPGVPPQPMQQPQQPQDTYGTQSYSPVQPQHQQPASYPQPGFQPQQPAPAPMPQQPYGPVPQQQPVQQPQQDNGFMPQQPPQQPIQPQQQPPQQPNPQQFTPPPPGYMPGQ
jgi:hypothetical protein